MDIVITFDTLIVFSLYAYLVLQVIISRQHSAKLIMSLLGLVAVAWINDAINHLSIPFIVLLFLFALCTIERPRSPAIFSIAAITGLASLSFLFATHKIPGFQNALLFKSESINLSTIPYSLYANFDKALAALALLVAFQDKIKWQVSLGDVKFILLSVLAFFGLCWLMGATTDLKFGELTFAFIFFNLFVTCLAEESFFRLLIQDRLFQNRLNRYVPNQYANWLAVLFTAILFTLAHFHTGEDADKRLTLIFLAGLLYGATYLRSRSLGSAVVIHFFVNIIHFSFFTYPATFSKIFD